MMRRLLRAVIREVTVTSGEGQSLLVDPVILNAADVLPLEEVEIVDRATGARRTAFVEVGEPGQCTVPHTRAGDVVSILSWGLLHDGQTLNHSARVVTVDAKNAVVAVEEVRAVEVVN
jgi:aspartate 1-decarboxylase